MPQVEVRRSEFAQQPSPLAGTARLLSGEFIILWKWERMSPVQRVQPSQVSTCSMWNACAVGSSGASLVCVWELVLLSAVAACPHGRMCPCVRFGERRKSTSLISAITKKTLLLEFRRARKGLIRSCKHLALYCQ